MLTRNCLSLRRGCLLLLLVLLQLLLLHGAMLVGNRAPQGTNVD